jgi:hypothetical protein
MRTAARTTCRTTTTTTLATTAVLVALFAAAATDSSWAFLLVAPTTRDCCRSSNKRTMMILLNNSPDIDIKFGSSDQLGSGGVCWGADDDHDDDDDDNGNNSVNTKVLDDRRTRRERVAELLAESDVEFKELRKQNKWGKFANISSVNDIQTVLQNERTLLQAEQARLSELAAAAGVLYTVLEPREDGSDSKNGGSVWDETGTIQISGSVTSWFAEVDEDLENEWRALTTDQEEHGDAPYSPKNSIDLGDVQVEKRSGKIVAREALAGVRVGSAGGWMLEVFPGDFVVHRKYGIGRFERTCLRQKTRLTPQEKQAQEARRGEILTTELRKNKSGVAPAEIQAIRAKFGTEEDTDPISNPQTTVLEISYADVVVSDSTLLNNSLLSVASCSASIRSHVSIHTSGPRPRRSRVSTKSVPGRRFGREAKIVSSSR